MEVRGFRIIPDINEPDDMQLTEALQNFIDLTCADLPDGVRYALSVYHPAIPFNGNNLFVNYRGHTGREGEMIVNALRTLIQSSKALSFTDSFRLEIATFDFAIRGIA